jgi:hypothetical protein
VLTTIRGETRAPQKEGLRPPGFARLYWPLMAHFRKKRMRQFVDEMNVNDQTQVLDVGGTSLNWTLADVVPRITFVNREVRPARVAQEQRTAIEGNVRWVVGDAARLPFADASFDVVYSNAVMQYLGHIQVQEAMASEIMRVGKTYYVQTPNRWFPVEPDFLTLFIHYLPKRLQPTLLRYASLRGLMTRPDKQVCARWVSRVRMMSGKDVRQVFPNATIMRERFLGLTKSWIVIGDSPARS